MKKSGGMMEVGGKGGDKEKKTSSIGRNTGYFLKQVKDMKPQM